MQSADKVRQACYMAVYGGVQIDAQVTRRSIELQGIACAACDGNQAAEVADTLRWVNDAMAGACSAGWLDGLTDDELRTVAAMTARCMRHMVTDGHLRTVGALTS